MRDLVPPPPKLRIEIVDIDIDDDASLAGIPVAISVRRVPQTPHCQSASEEVN